MDEARVEQMGAKPHCAGTRRGARRKNARRRWPTLMGRNTSDFEGTLFNFGIDVDLKDPKHYAVYVGQGGLGLPDRDYYLKPEFAAQKAKYQAYVAHASAPC